MTVGQARGLLLFSIVHLLFQEFHCITMRLECKNITGNDVTFHTTDVYATLQPDGFKENNISFRGEKLKPNNLTLDEKCTRGLPLSVRWTNYGPYASLSHCKSSQTVGLVGIFPHVIQRALDQCCHPNTRVMMGEFIDTIKHLEKSLSAEDPYDMMFPVGLQKMDMSVFKDLPVVPLVRAPRTTLFIPEGGDEEGKTSELFKTVGRASPILAFIFLSAVLSGVFIWVFDHIKNPDEFSPAFVPGVWEGFWWAVVTMTTVGYGDRAPRSILGRLFSIIWIVIGMSIIAIFTAMITASLSASIQNRFVIHGSVMGSVDGSQEERIGTGMNADIRTFKTPTDLVGALIESSDLEVAIMDNYLLSFYHKEIRDNPVRIKENLEQPINYGLLLAPNSSKFTDCFRRFVRNNPQEIFDIILPNLNPLKNPTDDISEEMKASQGFLQETALKMILIYLAGALGVALLLGFLWEYLISTYVYRFILKHCQCFNRTSENEMENARPPRKGLMQSLIGFRLAYNTETDPNDRRRLETIRQRSNRIRELMHEYDEFYEKWLKKLKDVTDEESWADFEDKAENGKNVPFMMVTYNGK